MTYPLFVDVDFEPVGEGETPTPLTPVSGVYLGYEGENGLEASEYFDWAAVAEYIRDFTSQFTTRIVGWDLRNLVWPAIVMNIVSMGVDFPSKLVIPMERKWNDVPMVDLRNVVLQGGFSDRNISLGDAYLALTNSAADLSGSNRLIAIRDIYNMYVKYDK